MPEDRKYEEHIAYMLAKQKGLIFEMTSKIEKKAQAEVVETAYCDELMPNMGAKKSELEEDVEKMMANTGQSVFKSAQLESEVEVLQEELAALAKEQSDMDYEATF